MRKYLLLFLAVLSSTAFSGVNKWVDANGEVHYSDKAPTGDIKTQTINTQLSSKSEMSDTEAQEKLRMIDRQFEYSYQDQLQMDEKSHQKAMNDYETQKIKCAKARTDLNTILSHQIVYHEVDGKKEYLDDPRRVSVMNQLRDYINQNCR